MRPVTESGLIGHENLQSVEAAQPFREPGSALVLQPIAALRLVA